MSIQNKTINIKVPNKMPKAEGGPFFLSIEEFRKREEYVSEGMFGFISWKWILPFVEWIGDRRCLEVMAGRGWWSYALQEKGISVHATDNFSWHEQLAYTAWNDTLVEMEKLDAVEAVQKYGEEADLVLMSWPYMDDTAYEVIKTLYKVNPKAIVVYIGEGMSGCTASDLFFDNFEAIDDPSFWEVQKNFESWCTIRDKISIGRFTPNEPPIA